ncbi:MAG: GTP-binding protein, partial [bacterium]|nr:GTP-binding protein [bacterium]
NQVSDLSPLQGLTNLTDLNFHSNQVSDLSPLQGLTNLTSLDARNNSISHLPEALLQLDMEIDVDNYGYESEGLLLHGNPLESPPPEIIRQGKTAIKDYFNSLQEDTTHPLNEVKVILVGDGAAGKTSLVNRIIGKEAFNQHQDATEGIDIKHWYPEEPLHDEDIQVRIWDFGGQEILHATHQFFLSKRSLYILVLDGRKDEKTEYWLKQIQSFGHNSPVLVVLNKIDQHPRFDLNYNFLKEKYPNILGFHRLSCKTKSGIDDFIDTLKNSLDKVELLGSTWSAKWFTVKERLETIAKEEHFISYDRYRQICKEAGIADESARKTLVEFLNDLGVVLHFTDRNLTGTHVLDPQWVTNAVYKIINSKDNGATDGMVPLSHMHRILARCPDNCYCYPEDTHHFIIGLMEKFELCYCGDNDFLLIPDLLEANEKTAALPHEEQLTFIFSYHDFFPRSIMPRFIVRLHKDIKDTLRWRTGVVLENAAYANTTALVKADEKDGKIMVRVGGDVKRDYLQVIRNTLHDIHRSFDKLEVEELIPLPGTDGGTVGYAALLNHEKRNKRIYYDGKLDRDFDVAQLLDGVVDKEKREMEAGFFNHPRGMEADQQARKGGWQPVVINNIIKQEQKANLHQETQVAVDVDVEVNVDISVELPALQDGFAELKELLAAQNPAMEAPLEKLGDSLDALPPGSSKEQLTGPVTKLKRFLEKLGDENSDYGKVLAGTKKGLAAAQKLGRTYNTIGQWIGLPHVPDVLLGKKS